MAAVAGVRQATATLAAATADTVTLSGGARRKCRLTNHTASTAIYFRTDGIAAVSAADENAVVLGEQSVEFYLGDSGEISLISAGTPTYTASVIS